jgi:hypothetical protein
MVMVGIVVGNTITTVSVIGMICGGSVGGTKNVGDEGGAQAFRQKKGTKIIAAGKKPLGKPVFMTPKIIWRQNNFPPPYICLFFG